VENGSRLRQFDIRCFASVMCFEKRETVEGQSVEDLANFGLISGSQLEVAGERGLVQRS
jgi:hypothetical protein